MPFAPTLIYGWDIQARTLPVPNLLDAIVYTHPAPPALWAHVATTPPTSTPRYQRRRGTIRLCGVYYTLQATPYAMVKNPPPEDCVFGFTIFDTYPAAIPLWIVFSTSPDLTLQNSSTPPIAVPPLSGDHWPFNPPPALQCL